MASRAFSIEDGNLGNQATVSATKNREYIDVDMSFAKKGSGDVFKKTSAAAVKQSLKNLLLTNRTEKPFSPYYGANLQQYLFELADETTEGELQIAIENNIRAFEPRINPDNLRVNVDADPDNNTLNITIVFTIRNSNETVEFTTRLNRLR